MDRSVSLVLEDGSIYQGYSFGADTDTFGEVVFCTSMIGYQEMLTDPSYAGQILIPTYPLIGNYGINEYNVESAAIQVKGFVVREECRTPSHYLNQKTIHQYLSENVVTGICGVDTRAITRKLRSAGVMKGIITANESTKAAMESLQKAPGYDSIDFVKRVSTPVPYRWPSVNNVSLYHIVILDCGLKYNILRILNMLGCDVTAVPCTMSATEILSLKPDGILLSPGPGNPQLLDYLVATIKDLIGKKPIMGICLGTQLIARAFGAKTFKLKFGHRGGNHPVRELDTGRIHITAQNHGYAVDPDSLNNSLQVTHINLNDNTIEGLCHKEFPVFAVQYHSEASPGPMDNTYLFDRFLKMIKES